MALVTVPLCSFNNGQVSLSVTFDNVTNVVTSVSVTNATGQDIAISFKNPLTGLREDHIITGSITADISSLGFVRPKHGVGGVSGEGIGARWPA